MTIVRTADLLALYNRMERIQIMTCDSRTDQRMQNVLNIAGGFQMGVQEE